MKYIVRDPRSTGVWIYEHEKDGSWTVTEPENAPILEHETGNTKPTLIDAVLAQHRRRGRVVALEITINEDGSVEPPHTAGLLIRAHKDTDDRRRVYDCSYCRAIIHHTMGKPTVHECPQAAE